MSNTVKVKPKKIIDIPNSWNLIELGELGEFSKGKGILKDQIQEDGIPCVRYGEIYTTHDFIIKRFISFINENIAKESKKIKKGDILFAGSGETIEEIGKAVAYIGEEKAYAGGDVVILSTNEKEIAEYLAYVLETDFLRKQKRRLGQGQSIIHIYKKDLSQLKIPLPPKPEQKKIAEILSTWDTAIEQTKKLKEAKMKRKHALMQRLLTGKKRLRGFDREWKETKLRDFIKEHPHKSKENNEYEVLTSSKKGLFRQKDYFGQGRLTERNNEGFNIIPSGYLTYRSRSDDGIFTFNINEFDFTGIVSIYYPVFKIINGNSKFFVEFCNFYPSLFYRVSVGTSQLVLSMKELKKITVKLPNEEEQKKIANVLDVCDKEIELLDKQVKALKKQKRGLMQKLLTGKVRVKIEEMESN